MDHINCIQFKTWRLRVSYIFAEQIVIKQELAFVEGGIAILRNSLQAVEL